MHNTTSLICHILTAKIWAVTEWRRDDAIGHDDVDDALLDEEHAITESTFLYNKVGGLEDLEFEQRDHTGDEVWVGTDEERDGCDQVTTIVVCDILRRRWEEICNANYFRKVRIMWLLSASSVARYYKMWEVWSSMVCDFLYLGEKNWD